MKQVLTAIMLLPAFSVQAQSGKRPATTYNGLTEIRGTPYVVATVDQWSKSTGFSSNRLLFIHSGTGEQRTVEFPHRSYHDKMEQVRVESRQINVILVSARTVDLNGKNGVNYEDPRQLFVLSPDGSRRTQITDDRFFLSTWVANSETGVVVISGRYDTNNNRKADNSDEARIVLYDLATMQVIAGR